MTENNATNAGNVLPRKSRIKTKHWALLVTFFMALMYGIAERDRIFGTKTTKKTNPCTALKQREQAKTAWKQELVEKRSNCSDKDSIEQYYDFQIDLVEGHLENISDSLKRFVCTE